VERGDSNPRPRHYECRTREGNALLKSGYRRQNEPTAQLRLTHSLLEPLSRDHLLDDLSLVIDDEM